MKYVDQLQTLSKEDATKLLREKLSSLAVSAISESVVSEKITDGNYYHMTDLVDGKMPWGTNKLPKDTSKHAYVKYVGNVPVEVKPYKGQEKVWNYKNNQMMSMGGPTKSWDNKELTPYTGKIVSEDTKKVNGEYSEHNPKIDLFLDNKYHASTNWADTAKNAIANAEKKHPDLKGRFKAVIAKKKGMNESLTTEETYIEEDTSTELSEGTRKVSEYENGNHKATIHKDSDLNEYKVKFYQSGRHHEPADYFTDDLKDAQGTAKTQVDKSHEKSCEADSK